MKDSIFLTIFAGVMVFVLGQFFIRLILDPIVSLKESLGEVSHLFLLHQAKITNGIGSTELQDQVIMSSATLLAKKQAIPCYKLFGYIFGLPSEKNIIDGCGYLNLISSMLDAKYAGSYIGKSPHAITINRNMKNIETALNIRVSYG